MERFHCEVLVLSTLDFGESDRIVTLLAEERGRLSAFAQGARKSRRRFSGLLEPFTRLEATLVETRGGMLRLDGAELIEPYAPLRADLPRAMRGFHALELVRALCREHEPHPEIYRLARRYLEALAFEGSASGGLLQFELRVLEQAGFRPVFDRCVRCHQTTAPGVRFDIPRGGMVCAGCGSGGGFALRAETVRTLARLQDGESEDSSDVPAPIQGEARTLLARFMTHHLGIRLKSLELLGAIE